MASKPDKPDKKPIQNRTRQAQAAFLKALDLNLGNVSDATLKTGISRETHYSWLKQYPNYANKLAHMKNQRLDFAESALFKAMQAGNPQAIIFYLKTQGRERNYIEKQETEHSGKIEIEYKEVLNAKANPKLESNRETSSGT